MNLVERRFSEHTTQMAPPRHPHTSIAEPKDSINEWTHNPRPFLRHKTADDCQVPVPVLLVGSGSCVTA